MAKNLKIAILISDTRQLPAWEIEMIRNIIDSGFITVESFIIGDTVSDEKKSPGLILFQKFEKNWFKSAPDAFAMTSVEDEFKNIKLIDQSDIDSLKKINADVIYSSGTALFNDSLKPFTKYGLWQIGFGSKKYTDAKPVAFWEVMNDCDEIGSSLIVNLPDSENRIIIYKGTTMTVPYSVKNTLNSVAWKSSSFLLYRLTELLKTGPLRFFSKYQKSENDVNDIPIKKLKNPGSFITVVLFFRNTFRYFVNKFSKIFNKRKFTLLYNKQDFKISVTCFNKFIALKLPDDSFWADPFIIEKDKHQYIFFEEFSFMKNKAHISVVEIDEEGNISKPVVVLEKPYHLSYPFTFQHGDDFYMIPETSINKTVELYKSVVFPFKWEFIQNLFVNIVLADATVLFYDNRWWLFGTQQNHPFTSTNDQLFLYYSDSLFSSDWISHPQNPVATHISNCRPAGKIFQMEGKLYRPAQNNSSKQYGYAIKINEIEILNENEYKEKEVFEIVPGKGNNFSAVHTINFIDGLIVIDGVV